MNLLSISSKFVFLWTSRFPNRSKMNGCFHRRGHEHSPNQHICLWCFHRKCWVSCCNSRLPLWELEDLGHVLMVRVFHVLKLYHWSCTLHRFPSAIRAFSCRIVWEYLTSYFDAVCTGFPVTISTSFRSSAFSGDQIHQILWRVFVVPRAAWYQFEWSRFRLGFVIGEPSPEVTSWPLFDMALCFPIGSERKSLKWLQENIEKMSASWFLVSTYSIRICGSKLILSNNQSSASLWVLDTCLIVGLRPLVVILVLVGTYSTTDKWSTFCFLLSVGVFDLGFCPAQVSLMLSWPGLTVLLVECNTSISMSPRSRAGSPSMRDPASNETISDSVELCETEVCFLQIQLMGTKGRLPKIHKTHTWGWFRVFKVTSKVWVLE